MIAFGRVCREMLIGHVTNMRSAFAEDGSEVEVVAELARRQEAGCAYIH